MVEVGEIEDLRQWMEERFDRADAKIDKKTDKLSDELISTRHSIKPLIEQLTVQLATNVTMTLQHDKRLDRHDARIEVGETWRNTMRGSLIAVSFFVPVITALATAAAVAFASKILGQ